MSIKIFSDSADLNSFKKLSQNKIVQGFTTNPTLMRKAGVENYVSFANQVLKVVGDKPVSFEVFADDASGMRRQASIMQRWGDNVYVKIPVVNSKGASMRNLIQKLHDDGIKLNVTAVLTVGQIESLAQILKKPTKAIVSVFAGRIADTGRDPSPTVETARQLLSGNSSVEILWASTREVLNISQAEASGAHIITVTPDILHKYECMNQMDLLELSRQTSEMFWRDAQNAGYQLEP